MPDDPDLAAYIADNYGRCDRGPDCYHGRDRGGGIDGCMRVDWRGVRCAHWHPVAARNWQELSELMRIA